MAGKPWVEFLLRPTDPEDLLIAGLAWGTLCQPDEVPAFLDRLAQHVERDAGKGGPFNSV